MKLAEAKVPLVTLNDCAKAAPIQRLLANAGIAAEIDDELLEKLWFVSKEEATPGSMFQWINLSAPKSFARVGTRPKNIARGDSVPECQSLQVHYPQFAHRSLIPNLMMGFLAKIGLIEKEYYCENCHYTWPKRNQALHLYLERKP